MRSLSHFTAFALCSVFEWKKTRKKVEALQAFVLIFHRPLDIASRTTMYKCLVLSMLLHLMYLHFTQLAKELAKV